MFNTLTERKFCQKSKMKKKKNGTMFSLFLSNNVMGIQYSRKFEVAYLNM